MQDAINKQKTILERREGSPFTKNPSRKLPIWLDPIHDVRLIYNRDDFEKKRLQLYRVLSCRTSLWHVSVILVDAFPTLEQNVVEKVSEIGIGRTIFRANQRGDLFSLLEQWSRKLGRG